MQHSVRDRKSPLESLKIHRNRSRDVTYMSYSTKVILQSGTAPPMLSVKIVVVDPQGLPSLIIHKFVSRFSGKARTLNVSTCAASGMVLLRNYLIEAEAY